jgi:hypothetical protein
MRFASVVRFDAIARMYRSDHSSAKPHVIFGQETNNHVQKNHTTIRIIRMSRLVPGGRLCLILLTLVMAFRVFPLLLV